MAGHRVMIVGLLIMVGGLFVFGPAASAALDPTVRVIQLASWGGDRANVVAYPPNGQTLVVGTSLGLTFYDAQTLNPIRFIQTDTWVRSVAYSPTGDLLATGSYDEVVRLWQPTTGALVRSLTGHAGWVRSVAFSPDGEMLASASDDNTVRLWRVSDGAVLQVLTEGVEGVRVVALSPDGTRLATGGSDNTIRLWRVSDGALMSTLQGHMAWVRSLAFSPDGKTLASGAFDATARLWRVADGTLLNTLEGHTASVLGLAFSPDGKTLATGSVDTTVRLWRVRDGKLLDVLAEHKDFVFSVAFSPDGKTLASGAVDNTVRLWDVEHIANATPLAEGEIPSGEGGQSCVACHHPRGDYVRPGGVAQPPRVVEASCAMCHNGGSLALNWCPAFPRSTGQLSQPITAAVVPGNVGVPQGNPDLNVVIASPANGEHFYSPQTIVGLPISGRVHAEADAIAESMVTLELWSGDVRVATSTTQPEADGTFYFNTRLSPGDSQLEVPIEERGCVACHSETLRDMPLLPTGEVRVVVTVTSADGKAATDERWIAVDRSAHAAAHVQVTYEDGGQPVPGLTVYASTRLYEWRGRNFPASTNGQGEADFTIEVLSEAATHYVFEVKPSLVNGVLYEGVAPVEVTLPPGATSAPVVNLQVRSRAGQIVGRVTGVADELVAPVPVYAIHLPEATFYETQMPPDGVFTFSDIPIGQYLISADAAALAAQGLSAANQRLDLTQSPSATVDLLLKALDGTIVTGVVRDDEGQPLPFASVSVDGAGRWQSVDPQSGGWTIADSSSNSKTVLVSSPGFYTQAHVLDPQASESFDFALIPLPETQKISLGQWELILPIETRATVSAPDIELEMGWLWGNGGATPLVIHAAGTSITLSSGRFALESVPGQTAWLYVFEGKAEVSNERAPEYIVTVPAGYMIGLLESAILVPVPMNAAVIEAIQVGSNPSVTLIWQPVFSAQLRDRLALIGINAAQIITFVTYLVALLSLFSLPLLGILWWVKRYHASRK